MIQNRGATTQSRPNKTNKEKEVNAMKKLIALCLTFVLLVSGITISYAADASVDSVLPAGGTSESPAELSAKPGQFVITFSDAVTTDIFSDIAFVDAEQNEVKGGIYPSIDTGDNTKVIVKYGTLDNNKKYTLKIGANEYTYLAKGFEVNEDFENSTYYTLGEAPVNNNNWVFDPCDRDLYLTKEDNSSQYLRAANKIEGVDTKAGDTTTILKPASGSTYITEDETFYIDMRVRGTGKTSDANKRPREVMKITFAPSSQNLKMEKLTNNTFTVKGAITDEYGFYNLRYMLKKDSKGKFTIDIIDKNNSTEPGKILTTYTTNEGKVGPTEIRLMHLNDYAGTGICYYDLDDIHMKAIYQNDVLHTNIDKIERSEGEFYVAFTNDIDLNSAENLTIADAEGKELAIAFDEEKSTDRKLVYKLKEYLAPSTNYTLTLDDIKDVYGVAAKTSEYQFTSVASDNAQLEEEVIKVGENTIVGTELPSTAAAVTLTTTVKNNSGVASDFVMYVIVYDKDGRIEKVYHDTENVAIGADATLEVNTGSTGDTLGEGYSVKRFAWRVDSEKGAISVVDPIRLAKPAPTAE